MYGIPVRLDQAKEKKTNLRLHESASAVAHKSFQCCMLQLLQHTTAQQPQEHACPNWQEDWWWDEWWLLHMHLSCKSWCICLSDKFANLVDTVETFVTIGNHWNQFVSVHWSSSSCGNKMHFFFLFLSNFFLNVHAPWQRWTIMESNWFPPTWPKSPKLCWGPPIDLSRHLLKICLLEIVFCVQGHL